MSRKTEILLWQPIVNGEQINSIENLHYLIDKEYPRLKETPQYELLMKDAKEKNTEI